MLKDTQLSTILLLVALGFLIYLLTKPKILSEEFAEELLSVSDSNVSDSTQSNNEVKKEVLNQILAEDETPIVETPIVEMPIVETPNVETQSIEPTGNQFEPSDIQESGADLNSAFQSPVPQQAQSDVVDINNNNVKKYKAKDFLPKEINNQWFDTDFSQAKFNINDDKLINTDRYVIGVNTVGQSLKNASYDIRGTVPNPKFTVSPWNNSTYEPDFNIKPLC